MRGSIRIGLVTAFVVAAFGVLAASATAEDGLLEGTTGQLVDAALPAIAPVAEPVAETADALAPAVGEVVSTATDVAAPMADTTAPVVEQASEVAQPVVEDVVAPIVESIDEAVAPVRDLVEDTVAPLVGAVEEVVPPPAGNAPEPTAQPSPNGQKPGGAVTPSQSRPQGPTPSIAIPAAVLDSVPTVTAAAAAQVPGPAALVSREGAAPAPRSQSVLDLSALAQGLTSSAGAGVAPPDGGAVDATGPGRAVAEFAALAERAVTTVASGASWVAGAVSTGLVAVIAALVLIAFAGCFLRLGPAAERARPLLSASLLERPG